MNDTKVRAGISGTITVSYTHLDVYKRQGLGDKFPLTNGKKNGVYWADYSAITLGVNIPCLLYTSRCV